MWNKKITRERLRDRKSEREMGGREKKPNEAERT